MCYRVLGFECQLESETGRNRNADTLGHTRTHKTELRQDHDIGVGYELRPLLNCGHIQVSCGYAALEAVTIILAVQEKQ